MAYKYERTTTASRRAQKEVRYIHVSKQFETVMDDEGRKLTKVTTSTRCRKGTNPGMKAAQEGPFAKQQEPGKRCQHGVWSLSGYTACCPAPQEVPYTEDSCNE